MQSLLLVMAGGSIGAGLRHEAGRAALRLMGPHYPWGTLFVNLAGGLLMGVLIGLLARNGGSESARLFFGVGILGGFTTFSAFSLEAATMVQRGAIAGAAAYAIISVLGSVAALFAGLLIARSTA